MEIDIKKIQLTIKPYRGILFFLILLFSFHFAWKIAIDGDRDSEYMYVFGKNVTPDWFYCACQWLTLAISWFVHLFPNTDNLITGDNFLRFIDGGITIFIIWGCTGIKQMTIFIGIMACYFGSWKKKCWYIPMGCLLLTIYDIMRVGGVVLLTNGHPDRFDLLHDGIFRYIYYTIIFLLWLYWEEKIVKKHKKHDNQRKNAAST